MNSTNNQPPYIIRVALSLPFATNGFDYFIDPLCTTPTIGCRVIVPFGKRHLIGIVIAVAVKSACANEQLKSVETILDTTSLFAQPLWYMLQRAAQYYCYPMGEVLFHALPKLLRQGQSAAAEQVQIWQVTEQGCNYDLTRLQRSPQQYAALTTLLAQPTAALPVAEMKNFAKTVLQSLQKKALIRLQTAPLTEQTSVPLWQISSTTQLSAPFSLTVEQMTAINTMAQELEQFKVWLLDGVTGSGKTEVYFQLLQQVLMKGQQVLFLVPEIGLIPQVISRLQQRFSVPLAIYHSTLTDRARLATWKKINSNSVAIIVGTRSAVFLPFFKLGLIIVDEEHDSAYKQQEGWRYHGRDVAVLRAYAEKIPLILGSATPALESLYNVQIGKYHRLTLTSRISSTMPVEQYLIDLKGIKLSAGLSPTLLSKIGTQLKEGNQVMLFLNRRGYAPVLLCHQCGWIAMCSACDYRYTLHQQRQLLSCHRCDKQREIPCQCEVCGADSLIPVGVGTEQLARYLAIHFPVIPIIRIDQDTTRRKGELEKQLAQIADHGACILIGTQMLAKGHHFPHITLVALVDVDGVIFSSDFRAAERFAQLYTQVAGRTGRGEKQGEVILQTHYPQHPLLQRLLQCRYTDFSHELLEERKDFSLPPYSYHAVIQGENHDSDHVTFFLTQICDLLTPFLNQDKEFALLGPAESIYAKLNGQFRWQILLQHTSRKRLNHYVCYIKNYINSSPNPKKIKWRLDIDPQALT